MIDPSKLSRDFSLAPLEYKEDPLYEDLFYLYIELNQSEIWLREYFKVSRKKTRQWIKKYNLVKTPQQKLELRKKTCLNKYGYEHANCHPEIQAKAKKTIQDKYGVNFPFQSKEIQVKAKEGFKKFIENSHRQKEKIAKTIETNNRKYNRNYNTQIHLSQETYNLLNNKEKFVDFIMTLDKEERTIHNIANKLQVHHTSINHLADSNLDIKKLINYFPTISNPQLQILELLKSWNLEIESNNRNILYPIELDLYNAEFKIAIEFNGNYWHRINKKGKGYHQNKSLLAEKQNIFIYHIFEYEWDNEYLKEKIKNQLQNLFNRNTKRIYARKCEIRNVTSKEAKLFLEENHLQGNCYAPVRLGLYYENELVSLMTFSKPRFNKNYEWELLRFCCKSSYSVLGGASRLFKNFLRNYNPSSIISYSDISKTRGNLYEQLGFNFLKITKPGYVYVKNKKILTRYQCQKHKLSKLLENYNPLLTETENMYNHGYYIVEDCGNKVWIWNS